NILGVTDVFGTGHIDVSTNGYIILTEDADDMRVGKIESLADSVELISPASILDAAPDDVSGDAEEDVIGTNITLTAENGIGADHNFLEIDSSFFEAGVLTATATNNIRIEETKGDLNVFKVFARDGDVTLATLNGSIIDKNSATTTYIDGLTVDVANVEAINIDLRADNGSIGAMSDDLDIDSGTAGDFSGRVYAQAADDIYFTESKHELNLLAAKAAAGEVRITVPDTSLVPILDRGQPLTTTVPGEDLFLLQNGEKLLAESDYLGVNDFTDVANAVISALEDIALWVGDDVSTLANSVMVAAGSINIRGDVNRKRGIDSNADAGFGSNMDLRGVIGGIFDPGITDNRTDLTEVFGHNDVDLITFNQTYLGTQTNVYGSQSSNSLDSLSQLINNDGEDEFVVNQLQTMFSAQNGKRDTLNLNGQADTDVYVVNTTGTYGEARDYIVNVLDSGAKDDGVDTLTVTGSDQADVFLLRRMDFIPGAADSAEANADLPAFVT
ncbi:MAG: hypothetical protein KAR12_16805, partial [Methylococcales bacterium]|nr:hypothetical protein [Methylococcales bacterium]